ncbi:MAG: bifunctional nicotinamide-nucleotide adenylyltransferase/Nudix hydroxylase [Pseudomonadota bacterium]
MAESKFDFLVFIGRFQPFHRGHEAVLRAALQQAAHVIVLVGSAHRPRCSRNPWSFDERHAMVSSLLDHDERRRTHVMPLMDATYNDPLWLRTVQQCVSGVVAAHHSQPHRAARIGLIGHSKDRSSYYLTRFPQWSSVDVPNVGGLNATDIRQRLFEAPSGTISDDVVPGPVAAQLASFLDTSEFADLRDETVFIRNYRAQWANAPYTPMFVTVDAVVVQSGHVLLVERKARPGRGQWALPGGFVDGDEDLQTAALRELKEETRIKVPLPVLAGSISRRDVFDDPHRSARGRTFTHAFLIELKPDKTLPKVRGGDDARHAFWVPLAELAPERCFEDHYFIVQRLVGGPR